MKTSLITDSFKNCYDDIFCIISTGSYFSDKNISSNGWKDIDMVVVVENLSIELQKRISHESLSLKKRSNIDISVDIVDKSLFIRPNHVLDLHTKTANAFYEANKNKKRILYFHQSEPIYMLSKKDVQIYTSTAFRELYQEAFKDISRNLDSILLNKDLTILKKYIKRIFNMVKMQIIKETDHIPQTKKETTRIAKRIFGDYDFENLDQLLDIIKKWPNFDLNLYEETIKRIVFDIYRFNNYVKKRQEHFLLKRIFISRI